MSVITVVVGCQWGDEGKGKICDLLARDTDYIVRFNGGSNAGHTIVVGSDVVKLHLVPSGALHSNVRNIIAAGVVIDAAVLLGELRALTSQGIRVDLGISQRAHVIMPYHLVLDKALSDYQAQLAAGSTQRGIGPVCADKYYRHGIRIADLLEPAILREKLEKVLPFNNNVLRGAFGIEQQFEVDEVLEVALRHGAELAAYVTDVESELYGAYKAGSRILFEGAQGMSLDPDHGLYPHSSSTNNVAGYASVSSGLGYNSTARVVGVTKAYLSRVGISPMPSEIDGEVAQEIRQRGGEFGTTTGRARRIGWCDLVQVRQAIRSSGINELAITKLDVLGGSREIGVCVSYKDNGQDINEMPASLGTMRRVTPNLKWFCGWPAFTPDDVKRFVDTGYATLPENLQRYIDFVESEVECPIRLVSLGPERDQTIVR